MARAKDSSVSVRPPVALVPELELPKGGAGPEEILGAASLLPELRGLPQLVSQLGAILILGLPANETRPSGQQGLVDDLHLMVAFHRLHRGDLVRGEKPSVDEFAAGPPPPLAAQLEDGK